MSYFLSSLPLWQLILLVVVIPTAVAMAAQVLIRKWVGVDKLARNNEIAGFKFATVGVIYAVLLAFVVIAVWEKFSDAQNAVTEEAGAIAALHHFTEGKEPETVAMQAALSQISHSRDRRRMAGNGAGGGKSRDRSRARHALSGRDRAQS